MTLARMQESVTRLVITCKPSYCYFWYARRGVSRACGVVITTPRKTRLSGMQETLFIVITTLVITRFP